MPLTRQGNSSNRLSVGIGVSLITTGLLLNSLFERGLLGRSEVLSAVLCFFVLLTGIALLIGGMADVSLRRLLQRAFPILVSLTILYLVFYLGMQFMQTGADRLGECGGLVQAATSSNVIPESKWRPGKPAAGCEVQRHGVFLAYYNCVGVHGVLDAEAQQRIVDKVAEHHRQAHTHPVQLVFYEEEHWTGRQEKNGVISGSGSASKLIRVVNIG